VWPVLAALVALMPVACGKSSPAVSSRAHAIASSTVVAGDEQAAARLVQSCVTAAHIAQVKSCLESKVPPAKRAALRACLASDAASSIGPGGKAKFKAGAQACVAAALKP
jgi:hypothetical protein